VVEAVRRSRDSAASVWRSGGKLENQTEKSFACADTEAVNRVGDEIKWGRGRAWKEVERETKPNGSTSRATEASERDVPCVPRTEF
jgi:hypothetical protein